MTDIEITYAKAGGPPVDWYNFNVFDENGEEIKGVIEANSLTGFLFRYAKNLNGDFFWCPRNPSCDRCESGAHEAVVFEKRKFTIKRVAS